MAQRRSLAWTELRVGILVIVSFVLLAVAIFYIGGESGIFTKKYNILVYFENANGLRSGAEVWLEGVTIGNVSGVRISRQADPNQAVEAELRLDERYKNIIRSDSKVTIGTIGLLGDKNIDITRGTEAGKVVDEGGALQGSEEGDIRKIVQGTNDFVANLGVLSDQVKRMAERVDRGEGTLGKFLTDTAIYDNANLTVKEANALVRDARTGNGTVGRLISDDEMYRKVNAMVERVDTLVTQVQSGHGTMGKFVTDPSVYNRVDQALGKFQTIGDRIERGEGTLGKLSKDEAVYNDFRDSIARFSALVTSIENGEGTAGKFIKDPTLYNTLNQTSSEILKLMYDFRQNPKKFLTINFKLF
jgi:phospholipid/cholesterol/gamma-HCH transport system substrate-binding protein